MLTEIHKNREGKNNTINQLDLIAIYRTFHLTKNIHSFFGSAVEENHLGRKQLSVISFKYAIKVLATEAKRVWKVRREKGL